MDNKRRCQYQPCQKKKKKSTLKTQSLHFHGCTFRCVTRNRWTRTPLPFQNKREVEMCKTPHRSSEEAPVLREKKYNPSPPPTILPFFFFFHRQSISIVQILRKILT